MTVPSLAFLGFTALVVVLLHLWRDARWRRGVLLAANLAFLATFSLDPRAWAPFAGLLAFGYLGVRMLQADRGALRRAFPPLCVGLILVYIWLKRYTIIPDSLLLQHPYVVVGLSYVFFRVLHLVIDAHDGTLPGKIDPVSYLNFSLNFASLVSGPIQRYQDYHRMERDPPSLGVISAGRAIERIVVGFCKVAVLSVLLHAVQTEAWGNMVHAVPLLPRVGWGAIVAAAYPLYLYANFSGYTDFVIGAARFTGIMLPENFDRPFTAENFINFWSRWHITLSSWLKTYVYSPSLMALARRFPSRRVEPWLAVLAFFVTFFLVGVWHGRTSAFIVFGILQGGGVAGNKLYQIEMARRLGRTRYRALCANTAYRAFARGLTFAWFTFTLFWFWSNWQQMGVYAHRLGGTGLALVSIVVLLGATALLHCVELVRRYGAMLVLDGDPLFASRYVRTVWCTALLIVSVSVTTLLNLPAPDIVYRAF